MASIVGIILHVEQIGRTLRRIRLSNQLTTNHVFVSRVRGRTLRRIRMIIDH